MVQKSGAIHSFASSCNGHHWAKISWISWNIYRWVIIRIISRSAPLPENWSFGHWWRKLPPVMWPLETSSCFPKKLRFFGGEAIELSQNFFLGKTFGCGVETIQWMPNPKWGHSSIKSSKIMLGKNELYGLRPITEPFGSSHPTSMMNFSTNSHGKCPSLGWTSSDLWGRKSDLWKMEEKKCFLNSMCPALVYWLSHPFFIKSWLIISGVQSTLVKDVSSKTIS